MRVLAVLVCFGLATPAMAEPPTSSLRPQTRSTAAQSLQPSVSAALAEALAPVDAGNAERAKSAKRGLFKSLLPRTRRDKNISKASLTRADRRRGSVCGDADILGEAIGPVSGKLKGCGVADAVRVRSVSGVTLSQGSIMECGTARSLKRWIEKGVKPAVKRRGGGVSSLRVVSHYSCRTRNSRRGAKISEHGKGRAIDIAGIGLRNGKEITVLTGWNKRKDGRALKKMHKAACVPFGTVLGPNADRHHRDHFHFDTARYRNRTYCR